MEGNTLTYGQTELVLFFDKVAGDAPLSDVEEMKAHDLALIQIEEMAKDDERPLTEQFIKELNEIILVRPYWKEAISPEGISTRKQIEIGKYKSTPNSVRLRSGEIHNYASPEETPTLMGELMEWYRENMNHLNPIHLAALFHYKFVCIHPFDDGNGRVSRLIMNYILFKNNLPPIIIKSKDKEKYLTALQKADVGDLEAIVSYIESQMIWSLELSIKAAKGQSIDEHGDVEKEIEMLRREKLTSSQIYKTPKVAYNLFNFMKGELWEPLEQTLSKFDDFFSEAKTYRYFNGIKVDKTRTIRSGILAFATREEIEKEYNIFEHDIAEDEVSSIQWTRQMLSLKSASKKVDIKIGLKIEFNESSYLLTIGESNSSGKVAHSFNVALIQKDNIYNKLIMTDEVENIIKTISNHVIEQIRLND
ncbi:Fic family protein [Reichenbachiella faecimaris]|nr:Fic family protein [Reichenbachiella faecimaris]